MCKKLIIAILFITLSSIAFATECQNTLTPKQTCTMTTPVLSCNTYDFDIYNASTRVLTSQNLTLLNDSIYQLTFSQNERGSYVVRLCDNSTRVITVEPNMGDADLTIMLFFLFATTIVLAIPFYMTKFSNEPRIDMLLRRCCRILGIYLITLDASAVLIIADQAGIPLTSSITFFIWLSGFAGYTMMIFTAIKALIDYSKLSQEIAARKRMGDGDNE